MLVPISGQVTGQPEADNLARVATSGHYGGGIWTREFEKLFSNYMGLRFASMTNSGSSANLLAVAALELPPKSRILTSAVNFPTTVNAIIQCGHIPVFVDADPKTLNGVDIDIEKENISAVIVAHTLGNPMDLTHYASYGIQIIEDCCDSIGSTINGRMVGRVGVMATASFYPAHHITTGEGGMVMTDNPKLKKIVESYRDWGRDCWCEPGCDNTCGRRFDYEPEHKYNYSRIGYNLKSSDLQAAVGVAQMDRLDGFIQRRIENWTYLRQALDGLPLEFVEASPNSRPSWFGFAFLTSERNKLARYLDDKGIGSRPIMGGNVIRQTAYKNADYRILTSLDGADRIHSEGLWVGVFPGITNEMREHQVETIRKYFNG